MKSNIGKSWKAIFHPIMLVVFCAAFCILSLSSIAASQSAGDLIFIVFGGIEISEIADNLNFLAIAKWFLLLSPLLLSMGYSISKEMTEMSPYVIPRHASYKRWWQIKMGHLLAMCFLYCLVGSLVAIIVFFLAKGNFLIHFSKSFFVLWLVCIVHLFLLCMLMLVSYTVTRSQAFSVSITLGLEGLTLIDGLLSPGKAKFMPGTWGMYLQSASYNPQRGFNIIAVVLIQSSVIIIFFFLVPIWMKRNGTASVKSL